MPFVGYHFFKGLVPLWRDVFWFRLSGIVLKRHHYLKSWSSLHYWSLKIDLYSVSFKLKFLFIAIFARDPITFFNFPYNPFHKLIDTPMSLQFHGKEIFTYNKNFLLYFILCLPMWIYFCRQPVKNSILCMYYIVGFCLKI